MPLEKLTKFGLLFSARIAGAVALFAVNLLIVRYLGLEALGTYAVFVSLVSIVVLIISSGFTAIAPVTIAKHQKTGQFDLCRSFVQAALKQGVGVISVIALGLLLISQLGRTLPFLSDLESGIVALITASALAALGFNGGVLVGLKKQVYALLPETFIRPVILFVLSGTLLATGLVTSISEILWLLAISAWLAFGYVVFRDNKIWKKILSANQEEEKSQWRSASLPWMGISLIWDFMIDIILLLMSVLAGSIEIAILHICFRYRVLAGFGMRTIHTLMMPEITEQVITSNQNGICRKLFQVNLASLIYSLGALAGFMIFGDWLLALFSSEAANALPVLLVISATMVVRAIFGPAPLVLAARNNHMTTLKISATATICALVMIAILYSYLGIMAAAVGYTGANLVISASLWYFNKRITGIDSSIFSVFSTKKSSISTFEAPSNFGA